METSVKKEMFSPGGDLICFVMSFFSFFVLRLMPNLAIRRLKGEICKADKEIHSVVSGASANKSDAWFANT